MRLINEPQTKYWSARPDGREVDLFVVHSIAEFIEWKGTFVSSLDWLSGSILNGPKVSAHYLIDIDGTIHQLLDPVLKAWHAGVSKWDGEDNLNTISIGAELIVEGQHNYGSFLTKIDQADCYTSDQYKALAELIASTSIEPYGRIVAHSDISGDNVRGPGQGKRDPGAGFSWPRLYREL